MIMIRMENMKKISVIIAAYNAEEYLSETMDSIFLQTMDNSEYEVIVINDGSSDSTLSILNSYKKNYSNLIIIDKENGLFHRVMVRTASKKRADELVKVYKDNTSLNLLKIDSGVAYSEIRSTINKLKNGEIDAIEMFDKTTNKNKIVKQNLKNSE